MELEERKSERNREGSPLINNDDLEDKRQCSRCCDFPVSIYFIVVNEFCERFCYYGMRAVLVLYLTQYVHMHNSDAMALFHMWVVLTYVTPLLGGYIADCHIGKFNTIVTLSVVYALGSIIMALTALPQPNVVGPVIGLLLIAFGAGGIKSSTSALGGDQIPPHKTRLLDSFFSVFYFTINSGAVLSSVITPLFRARVHCNGLNTCYPLAFGFSAVLMVIAIVVFICGKRMYIMKPPSGNVVAQCFQCAWHGFKTYLKTRKKVEKESWLDYADDRYDQQQIEDLKKVLRLVVLFMPMTIFWSLFDQQASRWTLQASHLDGHIYDGITLLPDQMTAINPFLILLFIPLFESFFYPLVEKIGIPNKPLRRMTAGLVITVISFLAALAIQLKVEATSRSLPTYGYSSVRLVSLQHGCTLQSSTLTDLKSSPFVASKHHTLISTPTKIELVSKCSDGTTHKVQHIFKFKSQQEYLIFGWIKNKTLKYRSEKSTLKKDRKGMALIRAVFLKNDVAHSHLEFVANTKVHKTLLFNTSDTSSDIVVTPYIKVFRNTYELRLVKPNNVSVGLGTTKILNGEIATILPHKKHGNIWTFGTIIEISGNTISILWQVPQYVLMTAAEVLVSITGLAFSYQEAPMSMKASVSAIWLVYVGLGNLIVAIVAELNLMPKESWNYVLFACLCGLTTVIFVILAYFYTPAEHNIMPLKETNGDGDGDKEE